MRLAALNAGFGAGSAPFAGEIHSVFAHACNIALSSGKLLSLVVREIGAVPCGFRLATPAGFSFFDHIRADGAVANRAGLLRIEGSTLSVDLRSAIPWRSNLDAFPIACSRTEVAAAWHAAWRALVAHGGAAPLQRQAGAAINNLVDAAGSWRAGRIGTAVERLIGLGDGLTPAGDDFLIGFFAGLTALPPNRQRDAFRKALGEKIAAEAAHTGTISRLYLEAALAGEVSEPLAVLAAAIGRGDARGTARAAAGAMAVGATSGATASYGLLLAARAAEPAILRAGEPGPPWSPP